MKNNLDDFKKEINTSYTFAGNQIALGAAVHGTTNFPDISVKIPLSTLNRHGLVAGATGTGKTKTLQRLTESLSENSVPTLIMDMKGDISGISMPGVTSSIIEDRVKKTGLTWKPEKYPVEFLSISNEPGVRLRATVSEFGPVLFSKILELNETQKSVLSMIYKYADDKQLPLVDLKDIQKLIQYLTNEGKQELTAEYGGISVATTGIILRKIIELEQQGAEMFFGEKSFDVEDLMRQDERGYGYINIMRLTDIQDKPKMFSTFMLSLLAEVYAKFPEEGDVVQPKLMIIIDEAHLIFNEASNELLGQLNTIIKLIRSKGVGIVFCTQSPTDIPGSVLSQLGFKIQHALRAFTAADRKAINLVAQNYPETSFYDVATEITTLSIGEAFVTVLNERGEPTDLVHTIMSTPHSRMDTITTEELSAIINNSQLVPKYNQVIDPQSAFEILTAKLQTAAQASSPTSNFNTQTANSTPAQPSTGGGFFESKTFQSLGKSMATSAVRNITGQITRGLMGAIIGGVLGGATSRRSSGRSLF